MNEGAYRYSRRNAKTGAFGFSEEKNTYSKKEGFTSDSALILMLVMFLKKEEVDLMLIMALLYIIS